MSAQDDLERVANELRRRLVAIILGRPIDRPAASQALAGELWDGAGGGRAGWAVRRAAGSVDEDAGRGLTARRVVNFILGRPSATTPTLADVEQRAFGRRLDRLRQRGIPLEQDDTGRWLRRTKRGELIPVETPRQLVQIRLVRAQRRAVLATIALALELGVEPPPSRKAFRWKDFDARLGESFRNRLARETARIAHDALIDTWRDAAWDRMEDNGDLWVRRAHRNACGACLALADGIPRPASDRTFYRHTNDRCTPVVWRRGRPRPTGAEIFNDLTEAEQDALFRHRGGRAKAQALRDGTIALADLVLIDHDRVGVTDYVLGETATKDLPLGPPGAG